MQLATFTVSTATGPRTRVGVVIDGDYVDVTVGYAAILDDEGVEEPSSLAEETAPPSMQRFLERGNRALDAAARVQSAFAGGDVTTWNGRQLRYDPEGVTLQSPVPRPNSLRDAMVYEEHVRNSLGDDIPDVWYEFPVYYKGNHNAIVPPDSTVEWPSYTEELDYELELAAVIGKHGRNVSPEQADEYIAGYTIFNDFSARDIQLREMQAQLGPAKGKDFANGLGPYLTTTDAIDVHDVKMSARVNGEVWSEGTPGTMYHTFGEVLAHVSDSETVYPGDVIGSGTVGNGCGLELDRRLSPGDTVELEVEGIGTLRHQVVRDE